ncbi:MAG: hypothetical protein CL607_13490 [Anaerolineaceae bacterium]|nr:hypothetical protein [Anaerolineaceae bacterium]
MRSLNAVAAHEQFIASGTYHQFQGQTATGFIESWTQHDPGAGSRLTRIDQDARQTEGWTRLVEVLQNPEGDIERCKIQTNHSKPSARFRMMKTDYSFLDGYVQVGRTINGETQYHEIELPPNSAVRLIDYSLFWGLALRQAEQADVAERPVFVPFNRHDMEPGMVSIGTLPQITDKSTEIIGVAGRELEATRYVTLGKRVIWLDNWGVPLRINQTTGRLSTVLHDYAHR